mmetsp:Transcript_12954/g.15721  ORF Transcript_12954/g.15721 Transcript_12954/m.15721 type:complete len:260 (-) Transcript_12954:84-863(-)|eukprot:CAMPEP_0184018846 /NCGR_PEP_ID=MMETSP0954-20121128/8393_1 /TAXON_ID=627963 /ORGANISM="Aplanochytrium sp, Strain PBS07" /LENGTH=259 /DNA_ID=CAMNT_0026300387 /DNA_START=156 /DNA_END=935 /DNA_ORIENTATION=-
MSFSEKYFNYVNGAVLLVGIVILAYAAYLLSEYDELVKGVGTFTVLVPLIFGLTLFLVGVIGCIGAKKRIKWLIILYFLIATVTLLVVLGMAAAILAIGGYLADVKDGEDLENDIMKTITDFQIALFNGCCGPQPGITPVTTLCAGNITSYCISDADNVETFQDQFGVSTCEYLSDVEIDGSFIVGNFTADATSCGGGDIEEFINAITAYIEDNIYTFGGINLAFAIILLLLVISACCLLFKDKDEYNKGAVQIEALEI